MKKIIVIIGLIIFATNIANASGFLHSKKAQEIYKEIEILQNNLGSLSGKCENLTQYMQSSFRINLTDANFVELFGDFQRNKCLMQDLDSLEKALGEVVRLAPLSEKACKLGWQNEIIKKVDELRDEIYCLRKYGERESDKKEELSKIDCAKNQHASDFIQNYNDANCKDETWENVFTKITDSWDKLIKKFEKPKVDYDAIKERAKNNAQNWVEKNVTSTILSSQRMKIGINWSGKTEKQRKENTENILEETSSKVTTAWDNYYKFWKPSSEISTILSKSEHLKNQEELTKKLLESQVVGKISSELDQEFFEGMEKSSKGIEGILQGITDDLNDLSGENPSGGNEDNLKTKKEGLESLLKKQDS